MHRIRWILTKIYGKIFLKILEIKHRTHDNSNVNPGDKYAESGKEKEDVKMWIRRTNIKVLCSL